MSEFSSPNPKLSADELYIWTERAAICEYDGGLSREDAEAIAWKEIRDARATRLAPIES